MSGVEEVRAGISLANEKARESLAALQQAALSLGEAQQALATATQGTAADEMQQANGMFASVADAIPDLQGTINAGMDTAEGYAGRL